MRDASVASALVVATCLLASGARAQTEASAPVEAAPSEPETLAAAEPSSAGICGPPPVDAGADTSGPPCGVFVFMPCWPGNVCVFPGLTCVAGVCVPS